MLKHASADGKQQPLQAEVEAMMSVLGDDADPGLRRVTEEVRTTDTCSWVRKSS